MPRPAPGKSADSVADVSKAEELLGYRPSVELRDGLSRTVDWFQQAGSEWIDALAGSVRTRATS